VQASSSQVQALKSQLRELLRNEDGDGDERLRSVAVAIDELVAGWLPRVVTGSVEVQVDGWPEQFPLPLRERLLRRPLDDLAAVPAVEAAALVREFDGMVLGGSALRVEVALADGVVLPSVPRSLRAQPMLRGRRQAWLPHLDEQGRRSLTPEPRARVHATLVETKVVIDGCCGCGGNAVAFARAGLQVIAVEREAARLELARRNAQHMGVDDRIRFHHAPLERVLEGLLRDHPQATVFIDPPWREDDAIPAQPRWPNLLPGAQATAQLLDESVPLLLKMPRSFDLGTLPERRWQLRWDFGEGEQGSAVVMLTLYSAGGGSAELRQA